LCSYERMQRFASEHPPAEIILNATPLAWILNAYRDLLYFGRAPDWVALALVTLASIPFTLLSLYIFRRMSPSFVKVL
ncbi:MAG: hypothetical protein ACKOC3_00970, partial [Candidatus Limnocylindrus sp.]